MSNKFPDQTVQFKSIKLVDLPALSDPDGCAKIDIKPSNLNGFIKYSQ
jgi:hypothetical protein